MGKLLCVGDKKRCRQPFFRLAFPRAGFPPEHECESAGENHPKIAGPHGDRCPGYCDFPPCEDAAEVREGNDGEDADGDGGEGFHGCSPRTSLMTTPN
jgi:hypothetical protein